VARSQSEDEFERQLASMAGQTRPDLVRTWNQLLASPPSKGMSATLLRQAVAYELQVRRWGGLSSGITRLLCKAIHDQQTSSTQRPPDLQPGSRLLREWNGREHVVELTEGGFEWEGRRYRSLSAVARAITGARWSGPRFFGRNDG
jgi:hypothetical protein